MTRKPEVLSCKGEKNWVTHGVTLFSGFRKALCGICGFYGLVVPLPDAKFHPVPFPRITLA
jgi:hypothetical protein